MPVTKTRKIKDRLTTPRPLYNDFRSLLREALSRDGSFKADYLLAEFESKLLDEEYSDSDEQRRSAAIKKWLAVEETNRVTSTRLLIADDEDFVFVSGSRPFSGLEVLTTARQFIANVVGVAIPWDELRGSFSGGASTKMRRGPGAIARKYQAGTNITEAAIRPFLRLTRSDVWSPRDFDLVEGNVMFTVPKSTTIDRVAAKEPELNMYAQKAVGDYIRRKLQRIGINLNDQTRNQELARLGSQKGDLATIDLSSASDSVTTQLVYSLMPEEWFHLMDDLRSHYTEIDGELHENVMFSSMGNGFTFELESLIFWGIVRAVCYLTRTKGSISVYGDDIICPSIVAEDVIEALSFCGFKVNAKKSFFEGPFRESCGMHWFEGRDVSPFYVKKVPVNVSDWIHLLNAFREWTVAIPGICNPEYYDLWHLFATEIVPAPLWGGGDLASRATLAAPGRFPIARIIAVKRRESDVENEYNFGAYLHWLAASEVRDGQIKDNLTTSEFSTEVGMDIKKWRQPEKYRDIPVFPQELGGIGNVTDVTAR